MTGNEAPTVAGEIFLSETEVAEWRCEPIAAVKQRADTVVNFEFGMNVAWEERQCR